MSTRPRISHILIAAALIACSLPAAADEDCYTWVGWYGDAMLDAGHVEALAIFQGELYAGGSFNLAGGQSANGLAKWTGAGWAPLSAQLTADWPYEPSVYAMVVWDAGDGEQLYVGGVFDHGDGEDLYNIARWDGAHWTHVDYGLASGGGSAGAVFALAVGDLDGDEVEELYAGGDFDEARNYIQPGVWDYVEVNHIAMWNGDWHSIGDPSIPGLNDRVRALYVTDDAFMHGRLLCAGGAFSGTKMFDPFTPLNRFACWDGATWSSPWNGVDLGANPVVYALCSDFSALGQPGVIIGGKFNFEDDVGNQHDNLVEWEGANWWRGVGYGVNGPVFALAVNDPDGAGFRPETLYVGGAFDQVGDPGGHWLQAYNAAQWYPESDHWYPLDGGVSSTVSALLGRGEDTPFGVGVFAGGYFDLADGRWAHRVASWELGAPPSIDQQPASAAVCPGDNAAFTVVAGGSPPLSYQWYHDGDMIYGATASSHTVQSASPGDAGEYDCRVLNDCGYADSAVATLTVYPGEPTIHTDPTDVTICEGEVAVFTVSASGTGALEYQWYKGGAPVGDDTSTLTLQDVARGDHNASIECVVTDDCDSATSATAYLYVNYPPSITTQPVSQTDCYGARVEFAVDVDARPAATFQWRHDGLPIGGATEDTYEIVYAQFNDEGTYDVLVGNDCMDPNNWVISDPATLELRTEPTIDAQPIDQMVCVGADAQFNVAASGIGTIHFGWNKNGAPVGGDNATLTLSGVQMSDDGATIRCAVTDDCGTVWSGVATLEVSSGPSIPNDLEDQSACVETDAVFMISAAGIGSLHYAWYLDGAPVGGDSDTYVLPDVQFADDGALVWCDVTDDCGTTPSALSTIMVTAGAECVQCTTEWSSAIGALGLEGGEVHALASYDDGTGTKLYAGGSFTTADVMPASYIAAWDGEYWSPVGNPYALNGEVLALAVYDPDGEWGPETPLLYVGGAFSTVDGLPVGFIATWDGSAWSGVAGGVDAPVRVMTRFEDYLCVGGEFTRAGFSYAERVALWNGLDWFGVGGPSDGVVNALASTGEQWNATLYVGGAFQAVNLSFDANNIARWSWMNDWQDLDGGLDSTVRALCYDPNAPLGPELYVGGDFVAPADPNAPPMALNRIARWAGTWNEVANGGLDGPVRSLTGFAGEGAYSRLMVGGEFTATTDLLTPLSRLAMLDHDVWSEVDGSTDAPVHAMHVASMHGAANTRPHLFLGGGFTQAGTELCNAIAQWGCARCHGDLDGDNDVDLSDLAQLLAHYGTTSGAAYEDGDLDEDGDVDLSDLAGLLAVYGTSCP